MRKLLFVGLISSAFVANAEQSGFYIGGAVGGSNQINNFTPSAFNVNTGGSSLNNSSWTFDGRIDGGYNLDKYNGFELGYMYTTGASFGLPDSSGTLNVNASTIDLSYILTVPVKIPGFSVFGRVGVGYDAVNSSGSSSNPLYPQFNPSGSSFADVLGAGVKWDVSRHFTAKVEWISNALLFPIGINSGGTNVANWNSQTFNVGIDYKFY